MNGNQPVTDPLQQPLKPPASHHLATAAANPLATYRGKRCGLVILDRDGVINYDSDAYIKTVEEWQPIPGSLEAIAALGARGITVAVATNQSGLARGLFDRATLEAMHEKMRTLAAAAGGEIDRVFICPHGPDDGCDCRKPAAGLFRQIADHYRIDLSGVPAIGDSLRDLQAAVAVSARPILVRTGKGERTLAKGFDALGGVQVELFDDLASAVEALLKEQ